MEQNNQNETELIKTIKDEYEKKLKEQEEKYKQELLDLEKKKEEEKVQAIKALMSGHSQNNEIPENLPQQELTFEEQLLKDTKEKFGLKGEN